MTVCLSFDLATKSAFSLVRPRNPKRATDPEYQVLDAGILDTPKELTPQERLAWFRGQLEGVMDEVAAQVGLIAVEEVPIFYKGAFAVRLQQRQFGVWQSVMADYSHIPLMGFSPQAWQRAILPYTPGRRAMTAHARRKQLKRLSLEQAYQRAGCEVEDDNVADSVNIAIYALRQMAIKGQMTATGGSE